MSFSAENIQTKQFNVRFRGFDIEEVDGFLEQVAEHYSLLVHEYKEMQSEVDKLKGEIAEFKSRETTFHHAILSAQRIADEIEAKSRREAEERLAKADEEVKRLQDEANTEIVALEKQLDQLKDAKKKIMEELKSYLASCLGALERDEVPSVLLSPAGDSGKDGADLNMPEKSFETGTEDDLEDLYEKIELPAEMDLAGIDAEEGDIVSEKQQQDVFGGLMSKAAEEGDEDAMLPDLNGDIIFTMNDPVDMEREPAVVIDRLGEDEKER